LGHEIKNKGCRSFRKVQITKSRYHKATQGTDYWHTVGKSGSQAKDKTNNQRQWRYKAPFPDKLSNPKIKILEFYNVNLVDVKPIKFSMLFHYKRPDTLEHSLTWLEWFIDQTEWPLREEQHIAQPWTVIPYCYDFGRN